MNAPEQVLTPLFDLAAAAAAANRLLAAVLTDAPLTATEYAMYSLIKVEPTSTTDLAQRLSVPLTTASDWVQVGLARRHLRRVRSELDRRRYELLLTASGESTHQATQRAFGVGYLALLEHLEHDPAVTSRVLQDLERSARAALDGLADRSSALDRRGPPVR